MRNYYVLSAKWVMFTLLLLAALTLAAVNVVSVTADPYPGLPADGRINIVHHFGGDALYCVDRNMNPSGQYGDGEFGGMRLLDISGQERWFISASDIDAASEAALAGGQPVLVGEGMGSYGAASLYAFLDPEGGVKYLFTAHDEYGKPNSMEFKFCTPVGPIPQEAEAGDEPLCIVDTDFTNVEAPFIYGSCDLCDDLGGIMVVDGRLWCVITAD